MIWDTDSIDQMKVDEYYENARNLAETADDKPKAIELLKRISYLHHLSNEYYVPNDIEDLRSMALEYLDSTEEYFTEVLYEIIVKTHQNFTYIMARIPRPLLGRGGIANPPIYYPTFNMFQ